MRQRGALFGVVDVLMCSFTAASSSTSLLTRTSREVVRLWSAHPRAPPPPPHPPPPPRLIYVCSSLYVQMYPEWAQGEVITGRTGRTGQAPDSAQFLTTEAGASPEKKRAMACTIHVVTRGFARSHLQLQLQVHKHTRVSGDDGGSLGLCDAS